MQGLRHASRRALHTPVMQKTFAISAKAYSSEAASTGAARKTKEERFELARQFISKFKAANNGQLPGITLLRKEVGGKYETLKEALEEVSKVQDEPDTSKQTGESKDAEEKTQEPAAAVKEGAKKKSPSSKEDLSKDKQETLQVSKSMKAVKTADPSHSRTTAKATESVMPVKDTGLITEDDDDDSDVAAPEYRRSLTELSHLKLKEGTITAKGKEKALENGPMAQSKPDLKKQSNVQAIKLKLADTKQPEVDVKQPVVQGGVIRLESPHKASDIASAVDDTAAKHPLTDGSKPFVHAPLTTVVRIVNLPQNMTASKLKALCEPIASVHEVDFRRGHIADVHFNVELDKMANIITRLRKLPLGTSMMRVFQAQRFFCGNNANNQFKPQDVQQYRNVRNSLFSSVEQRLKFLNWQLQDFRELQGLKQQVR